MLGEITLRSDRMFPYAVRALGGSSEGPGWQRRGLPLVGVALLGSPGEATEDAAGAGGRGGRRPHASATAGRSASSPEHGAGRPSGDAGRGRAAAGAGLRRLPHLRACQLRALGPGAGGALPKDAARVAD